MRFAAAGVIAILAAILMPLRAGAALGGSAATVDADQSKLKAVRAAQVQGNFTVHELTEASGTVVREFVSKATGKVFAVSWRGPFMPDLQQLLGDHFSTFKEAAARDGTGRGAVAVDQPGLVVRSGGHMRAFSGLAYVPDQLPEGVQVENLR